MFVRLLLIAASVFALTNVALADGVANGTSTTPGITATPETTTAADETTTTTTAATTTSENTTPEVTTTTTPFPDGIPKYFVEQDGVACLVLEANLTLFIKYFNNTSSLTRVLSVGRANVTGTCAVDEETMVLHWTPDPKSAPFNLTMKVIRLPKSPSKIGNFVVHSVNFEYNLSPTIFPSSNATGFVNVSAEGSFFETPAAMGFTCTAQQNISMLNVILGVSALHLEAFRNSSSTDFSENAFDCVDIPSSNKVVPIIVGVTAAFLILLAVVAFFIGNRRRAQGYQAL